jgi:EpsI family protein
MAAKYEISNKSFAVLLVTLMTALLLSAAVSSRGKPVVVETNLVNLPLRVNGMQGVVDSFPESVYGALNADEHLYRHYRSRDGREIDLYIGYYGTAKGGRTAHDPRFCMPAQGWSLVEFREIRLDSRYHPDGAPVNYLLATRDDMSITTIYWYQSDGTRVLSSGIGQNIQRFLGLVFKNRNDGAFVRVTLLSDSDDAAAAKKAAESFAGKILNLLPDYWPRER